MANQLNRWRASTPTAYAVGGILCDIWDHEQHLGAAAAMSQQSVRASRLTHRCVGTPVKDFEKYPNEDFHFFLRFL
jgi:hypothetical protein